MTMRMRFGALFAATLLFNAALPRAGAANGYDKISSVYDDVPVTPDRVLDIRKVAGDDETPLPGVIFKVYKLAGLSLPEAEELLGQKDLASEDIQSYRISENLVATLNTDPNGIASFNFTEEGYPDGIYMVEELPDVSRVAQAPFFLQIPGTSEDGAEAVYTVKILRKSVVDIVPELSVDVGGLDLLSASADAFRPHVRILRTDIPAGLGSAKKYTLSDTLPPQLTYVWGSPVVKLYTTEGVERQLLWDSHFYVSERTLIGDGEPKDHFTITFTRRGLAYIMEILGEGDRIPELRVYYEAYLDEDAVPGAYVCSKARVEYMNRYGTGYIGEAESAGVCTGGIWLHSIDDAGTAMPGAKFRIAREATEAELADPGVKVVRSIVDGRELDLVFISFVPGRDLSVPKVDTVTTDGNGDAVFCGLAHGTYYIAETEAPAGFDLLTEPIEVVIDDRSHRADDIRDPALQVVNPLFVLPQTGGMDTTVLTVAGLSVVCCASLMLLVDHRRGRL